MAEQSASQMREKLMRQHQTLTRLSTPEQQAEAIIKHYCRMSHMAQQAFKVIFAYKETGGTPSRQTLDLIEFMALQIKEAHLSDLGVELEWPKSIKESES